MDLTNGCATQQRGCASQGSQFRAIPVGIADNFRTGTRKTSETYLFKFWPIPGCTDWIYVFRPKTSFRANICLLSTLQISLSLSRSLRLNPCRSAAVSSSSSFSFLQMYCFFFFILLLDLLLHLLLLSPLSYAASYSSLSLCF